MKPKVCILRTDGTNCDEELFYAFTKYGAQPEYVQVNNLRDKSKKLKDFQILAFPGGFAYGDDIASGKILAVELISFFKNEISEFIAKDNFVLGVCNGFQTLIRTGLLPFGTLGKIDATLTTNDSGHFECRWAKIAVVKSKCEFLNPYIGKIADIAVNHGEGKLFAPKEIISKIENNDQVVFKYVDDQGKPTMSYPQNPSGTINAIAGICDQSGRILGLMPHPEKFVETTQHPNWRRADFANQQAGFIIKSLVDYSLKS